MLSATFYIFYRSMKNNFLLHLPFPLNSLTEPSRRPKKSLVATLTLLNWKQTCMNRARRRKKTKMKKVGTVPKSRQRGGWGGKAFLNSTSLVSWKAVTWQIRITRSVLQTCPRDSRCVVVCNITLFFVLCITTTALYSTLYVYTIYDIMHWWLRE